MSQGVGGGSPTSVRPWQLGACVRSGKHMSIHLTQEDGEDCTQVPGGRRCLTGRKGWSGCREWVLPSSTPPPRHVSQHPAKRGGRKKNGVKSSV